MPHTTPSNQAGGAFRTSIGGQALIEGILMRGPEKQSIVVRKPDGELEIKTESLHFIKERYPILGVPFIRGAVNFIDSMVKGVQALMYSAEFYPEDEEETPSRFELWLEKHLGSEKFNKAIITFAVLLGIGFSVVLFFLLPTFVAGLLRHVFHYGKLMLNLVEGIIRIAVFMSYLILCSRLGDIKRVFSYHGAEHKTIFCYERGLELTVDNVRKMPKHHPRCGTSFLFVIVILAILIYSVLFTLVTPPNTLVRMLCQLLLLPIIVGITYEINRYVGRHDSVFTRIITAPGMWMQNFTTNEPDDSMIEVGIEALKQVLLDKAGQDAW